MVDDLKRLTAERDAEKAGRRRIEREYRDLDAVRGVEVSRLTAERDAERSLREEYQIKLAFRSGELSRLRAVIEEARGHLEWAPKSMTYKEFNDSVLIAKAILDRGLKGAGE